MKKLRSKIQIKTDAAIKAHFGDRVPGAMPRDIMEKLGVLANSANRPMGFVIDIENNPGLKAAKRRIALQNLVGEG